MSLGLGQAASQASGFVRGIILARLMTPADYGVAAAFAMTLALLEMVGNLGSEKLLIQAADGEEAAFQNTAQLIRCLRGFWNASVLFLLAGPASRLFGVPEAEWAFRCLALLPLARGFAHLDISRVQRKMKFGPAIRAELFSSLLVTALAFPLAAWLRNYSAMLWILVIQSVASTVVSHLVAERPFGWSWQRRYARRMFAFGWPLVVNGILLYGIMEGDRAIIGSAKRIFSHSTYTLADLGIYSVAFALTMAPTMFISNNALTLFLPVLARVKDSLPDLRRQYSQCMQAVCLAACLISTPLIFAGATLVVAIYGAKYAAGRALIGWMAAMWGVRMIRTAPTIASMAKGETRTMMLSNLFRSFALLAMLYCAATGAPLMWLAFSGFAGEALALVVLLVRVHRRHELSIGLSAKPLFVVGTAMGAASVLASIFSGSLNLVGSLSAASVLTVAMSLAVLYVSPNLRLYLAGVLGELRSFRNRQAAEARA